MAVDRISYIKAKWTVLEYARDVLGLPVYKSGDRCVSLAPDSHNPTALRVFDNYWQDFKTGAHGDVIDLCAEARHGGDKGEAIRELAEGYGGNYNWKEYTQQLNNKIAYFHKQLREPDMHYLYRRGIKKSTVDRLKIGYDEKEQRLIIPYYKNGCVVYYAGRDRSGNPEASKYKKAKLDDFNENIPWGLHSFTPQRREEVKREITDEAVRIASNTPENATEGCGKNGDSVAISNSRKIEIIDKFGIIAEGAFDVLSFEQEGFKVLSPIGGYFNKEAIKQVINIAQTQDCMFICFDNDEAGKRFQVDMAKKFFKHRIKFVCGSLPAKYKDVSEYYADGGDLFKLVEEATSGIAALASRITDRDDFKKFVYDAARFVDEPELTELFENTTQFSETWLKAVKKKALKTPVELMIVREITEAHRLKYVEGLGFYEYLHGVWISKTDNAIKNYVASSLGHWASGGKLESVLNFLKADTTTEEFFNRKPIFNFRNCILDLETGETHEHSEAYMSSVQMSYDYDINAKCPKWEKFIDEIMNGREAQKKLLQEMTGYILYEDCSLQKCFFLMGDGANGKSVFLNVISAVFGEANVSNVEMSSLLEPFQRINLINSLVNISTETSSSVKGSESLFKQIVVGDTINGCYKNKNFINFKPRCVMISACNEYIKSRDTTTGFLRRICFIDFPCKFEGERADPNLENKLKTELAGIFNWSYEGFKRLKQQGKFTENQEQDEMMNEFIQIMNPVAAFIEECLNDEEGKVDRSELYRRYTEWAKSAGHEAQSRTKFIQTFRKTIKQVKPDVQEVIVHGVRCFKFPRFEEGDFRL